MCIYICAYLSDLNLTDNCQDTIKTILLLHELNGKLESSVEHCGNLAFFLSYSVFPFAGLLQMQLTDGCGYVCILKGVRILAKCQEKSIIKSVHRTRRYE